MCTEHAQLEPGTPDDHSATGPGNQPGPEGYGSCKECACKQYYPVRVGGACQTPVSGRPNGVCGHHYDDHRD